VNGHTTKTEVTIVVNCQLISYDKNKMSESVKDITYSTMETHQAVDFGFVAFPARCGGNAVHTVTVDGKPMPEWMTIKGNTLMINQTEKTGKNVGTFKVKIDSKVSGISTARTIDFKINSFLDDCLQGGVLPTSVVPDFTYTILEKQTNYDLVKAGTQSMATNVLRVDACKSAIKHIAQVQLPNTHAWVELNANTAETIDKYLAWDSATGNFNARVKAGVAPQSTDDFKVAIRVSTTVTHSLGKILGEGLSASWTFKVVVNKRPEDICKVEYLKADWNSQSAQTVSVNTGRRLQAMIDEPMALAPLMALPSLDPVAPLALPGLAPLAAPVAAAPAVAVFPVKTAGTDIK